jgi:hypothetical protein
VGSQRHAEDVRHPTVGRAGLEPGDVVDADRPAVELNVEVVVVALERPELALDASQLIGREAAVPIRVERGVERAARHLVERPGDAQPDQPFGCEHEQDPDVDKDVRMAGGHGRRAHDGQREAQGNRGRAEALDVHRADAGSVDGYFTVPSARVPAMTSVARSGCRCFRAASLASATVTAR